MTRYIGFVIFFVAVAHIDVCCGQDSTFVLPSQIVPAAAATDYYSYSVFDTIGAGRFFSRHAFSLDHFLEYEPGFLLRRRGPIGGSAFLSRFGIGRGRAVVYLGGVPVNDPQTQHAPLALIPTTAVGHLVLGDGAGTFPDRSNIEGVVQVVEPFALDATPATNIELSKGDRDLRQRRVRYSSTRGPMGLDLMFDELLNDGYSFDARGIVDGPGIGGSSTRSQGLNLRGVLPDGERYRFSFRRFTSVFNGDLQDFDSELRRDGHLASLEAEFRGRQVGVFERGYKTATTDSTTHNQTVGIFATVPVEVGGRANLAISAGYEDIVAKQTIGGAFGFDRLKQTSLGAHGTARVGAGLSARFSLNQTHYHDMTSGWGATIGLSRRLGRRYEAVVEVRRGYRMPNLAELFLPDHPGAVGATRVVGNRYLGSEYALEVRGRVFSRVGPIEHEVRATSLRIENPILATGAVINTQSYIRPEHGRPENLTVVENRARLLGNVLGFSIGASGGAALAIGDRERYFDPVPDVRADASLTIGREMFNHTSELFLTGDFHYVGERGAGDGIELPSYGVVNVRLTLRLVDARLYVLYLNALDEKYETVSSFLMTPRTFVYGVSWTLFD